MNCPWRVAGLIGTVRAARLVDGIPVGYYIALSTWTGALWTGMPPQLQHMAENDIRWAA